MALQKEKCEFGLTLAKFLGHVVPNEGVKLDSDKVTAICDLKPPSCKKESHRLTDMVWSIIWISL